MTDQVLNNDEKAFYRLFIVEKMVQDLNYICRNDS